MANPRQCYNISIVDDTVLEVDEVFNVTLVQSGTLPMMTTLNRTAAYVQINDDDSE